MKFKYLIINTDTLEVRGTNDADLAEFARTETHPVFRFVVDLTDFSYFNEFIGNAHIEEAGFPEDH